jgi:flagellar biosynthesis/type III secretory pathway protein FliH
MSSEKEVRPLAEVLEDAIASIRENRDSVVESCSFARPDGTYHKEDIGEEDIREDVEETDRMLAELEHYYGEFLDVQNVLDEIQSNAEKSAAGRSKAMAEGCKHGIAGFCDKCYEENRGARYGQQIAELRWIIRQVYESLPTKRDWLDPVLEAQMREVAGKERV